MSTEATPNTERIWTCSIGGEIPELPHGADQPMREAVQAAFKTLTGKEAEYAFTGWDGTLTDIERAVAGRSRSLEHP